MIIVTVLVTIIVIIIIIIVIVIILVVIIQLVILRSFTQNVGFTGATHVCSVLMPKSQTPLHWAESK